MCVCELTKEQLIQYKCTAIKNFLSLQETSIQTSLEWPRTLKNDIFENIAKKYLFGHSESVAGEILIAKDA